MQASDICGVEKYKKISLKNFGQDRHLTVNGHRSFKLSEKVIYLW